MATTYVRSGGGIVDASRVIGCKVENPMGEHLGKLEGLMVDLTEGRILYAILAFGGFLGMGDKLFPVPLTSFSFRYDKDGSLERCIINVDKDTLKSAPGYDPEDLSQPGDREFISRIFSHYGVSPWWDQ
jgi:hypothetical protein